MIFSDLDILGLWLIEDDRQVCPPTVFQCESLRSCCGILMMCTCLFDKERNIFDKITFFSTLEIFRVMANIIYDKFV